MKRLSTTGLPLAIAATMLLTTSVAVAQTDARSSSALGSQRKDSGSAVTDEAPDSTTASAAGSAAAGPTRSHGDATPLDKAKGGADAAALRKIAL